MNVFMPWVYFWLAVVVRFEMVLLYSLWCWTDQAGIESRELCSTSAPYVEIKLMHTTQVHFHIRILSQVY